MKLSAEQLDIWNDIEKFRKLKDSWYGTIGKNDVRLQTSGAPSFYASYDERLKPDAKDKKFWSKYTEDQIKFFIRQFVWIDHTKYGLFDGHLGDIQFVPKYAFLNNKKLKEFIPTVSIQYIEDEAFCGCSNLSKVELPETMRLSIYTRAFKDCTSLTHFDFPACTNGIGEEAFDGCSSLTEISFKDASAKVSIDETAF